MLNYFGYYADGIKITSIKELDKKYNFLTRLVVEFIAFLNHTLKQPWFIVTLIIIIIIISTLININPNITYKK